MNTRPNPISIRTVPCNYSIQRFGVFRERLLSFGIAPLHLLSGRGHHLVWCIRQDSTPFRRLAELGQLVDTLRGVYRTPQSPQGDLVGLKTGAAFAGIGQVLEFVAHRVLREVKGVCPIDVRATEVETDCGQRGREIISLDLSEYGDPLPTRMIRIPFSVYHKPRQHRRKLGGHVVDDLPLLFLVPTCVRRQENVALGV